MLARDYEWICKITLETVRVSVVHCITERVVGIHYGLPDDIFGVVVHFDDAVEILAVVGVAVLCFVQVEGADAWDVGSLSRGADAVGDAIGCPVTAVLLGCGGRVAWGVSVGMIVLKGQDKRGGLTVGHSRGKILGAVKVIPLA